MSTSSVVRARIDDQIKEEAAIVLASMGLTISSAFRMLLIRIATEKALPFHPLVPNAQTIEAVKTSRTTNAPTVESVDDLLPSSNSKRLLAALEASAQNLGIELDEMKHLPNFPESTKRLQEASRKVNIDDYELIDE